MKPKAVILSGGPASVHEAGAPLAPPEIFAAGVPVLSGVMGFTGGVRAGSDMREL